MNDTPNQGNNDHWERSDLLSLIFGELKALGKDRSALTIDDLAPFDQFHGGGKASTEQLARAAGLSPDMYVLDVGGGLGGPARTLAVEFGCRVQVLEPTESYLKTGVVLTNLLGLDNRVVHRHSGAVPMPFRDGASFDVVWTQNSGMNIADKQRLYAEFHRVLRPGGVLAFHEPMAGPVQPLIFPTMWARDGSTSFLRTPDEMLKLIEAAGFRARVWEEITLPRRKPGAVAPKRTIADLVMGDAMPAIDAANDRNIREGRMVMVQAVFERV